MLRRRPGIALRFSPSFSSNQNRRPIGAHSCKKLQSKEKMLLKMYNSTEKPSLETYMKAILELIITIQMMKKIGYKKCFRYLYFSNSNTVLSISLGIYSQEYYYPTLSDNCFLFRGRKLSLSVRKVSLGS